MVKNIFIFLYMLIFFFSSHLYAKNIEVPGPWESTDITDISEDKLTDDSNTSTFIMKLINWYQLNYSEKTIHRCIFQVSCSSFAENVIKEKGVFIGVLAFIDRINYREHSYAYKYYASVNDEHGKQKLNDNFYLR